jgi:hypothetical protein
MPLPNQLRGNTYYNTVSAKLLQHIVRADAKVDHQINDKNHIIGRYSIINNDEEDPNPFTTLGPSYSRGQRCHSDGDPQLSPNWITEGACPTIEPLIFGGIMQAQTIMRLAFRVLTTPLLSMVSQIRSVDTRATTARLPINVQSQTNTGTFNTLWLRRGFTERTT